jgi:toxin-antitoxin system PIN domain toxin
MILIDANILLYAYDAEAPQHSVCRKWLEGLFRRQEAVGFAWSTILSFLRLSTDGRVFRVPRQWKEAEDIVSGWLDQPTTYLLQPGEEHWVILSRLIREGQAHGALIMDAHLAALAIEHGAALCTNDRDFTRFPGLQLLNPLEAGER